MYGGVNGTAGNREQASKTPKTETLKAETKAPADGPAQARHTGPPRRVNL
jgi:hypothetical protein